jgi:hypothetical protein
MKDNKLIADKKLKTFLVEIDGTKIKLIPHSNLFEWGF